MLNAVLTFNEALDVRCTLLRGTAVDGTARNNKAIIDSEDSARF